MEETSRALKDEMRQEKKVIKMGYLVKSPSKSRDKAKYAFYWKLRWCVLLQEVSEEFMHSVAYSKFVLYYYEDEESYRLNAEPKGHLDLSHSNQIKSCFKACAGFDHLFEISCSNGKHIKFSASSCTAKFLWFDVLFKYIHNIPIQQLKSSKVISQSKSKRELFDRPLHAVVGPTTSQKPRSVSLNQAGIEVAGKVWKAISSISSDDDPPQLPPPRRGSHQGVSSKLLEDQNPTQCRRSVDFGKNLHNFDHLPTDKSFPSEKRMSSKKLQPRRATSLKELKSPSSIEEYFHCEKCRKGKRFGSKGIKRGTSLDKALLSNAKEYAGDVVSSDSTDAFVEARIYEEIDDKWLEMVKSIIAASETKEVNTETVTEDKCDGISFSQTDDQDQFRESQAACASASNAVPEGRDEEERLEGSTAAQDALNQADNNSNPGGEYEEIYVQMNLYSIESGSDRESDNEALDSSELENEIYESMDDIVDSLKDLEVIGTEDGAQSPLNYTETEPKPTVAPQEQEEMTNIVKHMTIDQMGVADVIDKVDSEDAAVVLAQETRQSAGCFGRLELSGFSEQYNTKL